MTLLLDEIDVLDTSGDPSVVDVTGVEHDSRRVRPGDLFCCLVGSAHDGHDHAADAVERGAVGLVCERDAGPMPRPVVRVRVHEGGARPAMARAAAAMWGHPASSLVMAGVTGTNGKTTVSSLLGTVLERAGHPTTVIGTLTGARTTPESTDLQRALAAIRDRHAEAVAAGGPRPAVAMEVTSHALVQARVDTICFDVAAFTNLSQDHLDFHGTMEAYFAAKATLFEPERAAAAVVDADDEWGSRLVERALVPTVAVRADQVQVRSLEPGRSVFAWRGREVALPLTGLVNVRNAHLAAEAAVVLGVGEDVVASALSTATPVPGRLERIGTGGLGFEAVVDYAHTPAALEASLSEARRLAARQGGRTIVVFGCGGDRDRSKRPVMGSVASALADVVVVTSDNPRSEDPIAIIDQVLAGVDAGRTVLVEPDRHRAIEVALGEAGRGDVVVVAGKGHETEQVVGEARVPFDDRTVVRQVITALAAAHEGGAGARGRGR